MTALLCLLLSAVPALSQNQDPVTDLIIRNVRIVNPSTASAESLANIKIKDGLLRLISGDNIEADDESLILDANNGFLLGKLTVGAPPLFMILDQNPIDDIKVLLDTSQHVVFAIEDQTILTNTLTESIVAEAPAVESSNRWLAYDPPPFALPSSVSSEKWNTWKTKWVNGLFISALALDRQYISQDSGSVGQFGDLESERGRGTIRGWRFGTAGTINFEKPWLYNIAGAWNSFDRGFDSEDGEDEFQFFDFAVDIPVSDKIIARVGKQKEPINMDRSMTMVQIPSQERYAAADAMFPTRNVGITLYGSMPDQRVSWSTGIFNDWLTEGEDFNESATQGVGRVTWVPYLSEDENTILHVGAGLRYTDAKQGLAYSSRPEVGNSPKFVDTGFFEAESSALYNTELGWRSGPYWLMAEYSDNRIDAPTVDDPNFTGYHLSAAWSLSGEMRPYRMNRGVFGGLPVAHTVPGGGAGAVELGVRYSTLDLNDGGIDGGEIDVSTVQLNWWLTQSMAVSLNYKHTTTDRFDTVGEMDALVARVILILQ